jgi:tRNA(His) 5'-end guanylyltransferase
VHWLNSQLVFDRGFFEDPGFFWILEMSQTQIAEQIRHLDFQTLGDEMKRYEKKYNSEYLMPGLPTVIRFDGNSFHTFTKGLTKPFDYELAQTFQCTVDDLIKELNPDLAYHQSDEISLFWFNSDANAQLNFDGKVQKWLSVYAAKCSVIFNSYLQGFLPNKFAARPVFDARVFQFPKWDQAYDYFVWRQWDARKNSVSMAAHSVFNNSELLHKNTAEKIQMLHEVGINFYDYLECFRQGTFTRKVKRLVAIDDHTWSLIPDANKPASREVMRSSIEVIKEVPKLTSLPVSQGSFKIFHEGK